MVVVVLVLMLVKCQWDSNIHIQVAGMVLSDSGGTVVVIV